VTRENLRLRNQDLHGNAPDHSQVVLLLIDVINDFEFEGGKQLIKHAEPAAQRIADLKRRAKGAKVPIVYVNDNFGRWRSDFRTTVAHCLEGNLRGKRITQLLAPDDNDYFVLKPKHSGFFSTSLDLLLQYLGAQTLILTGFAGNNCVLFTANDAYLRDYNILVPRDCAASIRPQENDYALKQMQQVLKADVRPSAEIDFKEIELVGKQRMAFAGGELDARKDSAKKRHQKVGIPDKRRGQQMGLAGQPDKNRARENDAPASRGKLKQGNKMFADVSSQQISSSAGSSRSNSPSTPAMNTGVRPGETTAESVFRRRLKRSKK